jgi:hypothetical protein
MGFGRLCCVVNFRLPSYLPLLLQGLLDTFLCVLSGLSVHRQWYKKYTLFPVISSVRQTLNSLKSKYLIRPLSSYFFPDQLVSWDVLLVIWTCRVYHSFYKFVVIKTKGDPWDDTQKGIIFRFILLVSWKLPFITLRLRSSWYLIGLGLMLIIIS